MREAKVILGVDPGFHITGFGILKHDTSTFLLDYGYLKMSPQQNLIERIGIFHDFILDKIIQYKITDLALETPFLGKNAQNFLKLGYLRGTLYLLANKNNLIVHEYSPRQVKQALTGWGAASKDQVARVILKLFPSLKMPERTDVTDALAITLCGLWQKKNSYF